MPHDLVDSPRVVARQEIQNRIRIDTAICGGRPHIRGTRVRVSDILDLLAEGVSPSEILADYTYLVRPI